MPKTKAGPKNKKAPTKKQELTPKQKLFIREYLVDMNGTRAYAKVYGCRPTVAASNAERLMRKAEISKAINARLGCMFQKLEITNDAVLQEIAKVAYGNMFDFIKVQSDGTAYVDLSNLSREQAAAISEMQYDEEMEGQGKDLRPVKKVKFRLGNKLMALDMLGKYLKLFSATMQPPMSSKARNILRKVRTGKMDKAEAAYLFTEIGEVVPEILKIEISKEKPEPPPPEPPPALNDAELEERYREALRKTEEQAENWVPERKEEVEQIKDELKGKDSFAPGAEGKG